MRNLLSSAVAGATLLFAPSSATAHPHVWIDMTTQLLFDKNGFVRGMGIAWVFDPFYSASLHLRVKEIEKTGGKDPYGTFAKNMVGRIKEHGYFTEVTADTKRLAFSRHGATRAGGVAEGKDKGRFWVHFELILEKAVDPKRQNFVYAVYDPTFYIEILHREKRPAFTMEGIKEGVCRGRLIKPNPDAEAKTIAASLDKTQSAGNTLGRLFAERVSLQCD
ncbi:MAG: DUF1007 family protein [Proteobacteria bacterium]|nr:DUF1007 family protein [Pseudomonadota bacterium]